MIPHRARAARSSARGGLAHSFQQISQHYRVVVLFIPGCEKQRQLFSPVRQAIQFIERFGRFRPRQLFEITLAKNLPSFGARMEPLAQCIGRRQVTQPFIYCRARLAQPAWPEPVH